MSDNIQNRITASQSNGNDTGASILCPGTVVGLTAKSNTTANLVEAGGTCTKLGNKTP